MTFFRYYLIIIRISLEIIKTIEYEYQLKCNLILFLHIRYKFIIPHMNIQRLDISLLILLCLEGNV